MKTDKCWNDMVSSSGACDNTGQKIMDSLQFSNVSMSNSIEDGVAVIKASGDHCTCYRLASILGSTFSDNNKGVRESEIFAVTKIVHGCVLASDL